MSEEDNQSRKSRFEHLGGQNQVVDIGNEEVEDKQNTLSYLKHYATRASNSGLLAARVIKKRAIYIGLGVLLVIAIGIGAVILPQIPLQIKKDDGIAAYSVGDYVQAQSLLGEVIAKKPNDTEAKVAFASSAYYAGDYRSAKQVFSSISSQEIVAYGNDGLVIAALALVQERSVEQAIKHLQHLLEIDNAHISGNLLLGLLLLADDAILSQNYLLATDDAYIQGKDNGIDLLPEVHKVALQVLPVQFEFSMQQLNLSRGRVIYPSNVALSNLAQQVLFFVPRDLAVLTDDSLDLSAIISFHLAMWSLVQGEIGDAERDLIRLERQYADSSLYKLALLFKAIATGNLADARDQLNKFKEEHQVEGSIDIQYLSEQLNWLLNEDLQSAQRLYDLLEKIQSTGLIGQSSNNFQHNQAYLGILIGESEQTIEQLLSGLSKNNFSGLYLMLHNDLRAGNLAKIRDTLLRIENLDISPIEKFAVDLLQISSANAQYDLSTLANFCEAVQVQSVSTIETVGFQREDLLWLCAEYWEDIGLYRLAQWQVDDIAPSTSVYRALVLARLFAIEERLSVTAQIEEFGQKIQIEDANLLAFIRRYIEAEHAFVQLRYIEAAQLYDELIVSLETISGLSNTGMQKIRNDIFYRQALAYLYDLSGVRLKESIDFTAPESFVDDLLTLASAEDIAQDNEGISRQEKIEKAHYLLREISFDANWRNFYDNWIAAIKGETLIGEAVLKFRQLTLISKEEINQLAVFQWLADTSQVQDTVNRAKFTWPDNILAYALDWNIAQGANNQEAARASFQSFSSIFSQEYDSFLPSDMELVLPVKVKTLIANNNIQEALNEMVSFQKRQPAVTPYKNAISLGDLSYFLGQYSLAISQYDIAIELSTDENERQILYMRKAICLQNLAQYDESSQIMLDVDKSGLIKSPEIKRLIAANYRLKIQDNPAKRLINDGIKIYPSYAENYLDLAAIAERGVESREEVVKLLTNALRADSKYLNAYQRLSEYYSSSIYEFSALNRIVDEVIESLIVEQERKLGITEPAESTEPAISETS